MTPDSELLAVFARDHSDAAFAELVRRHVDLVYSAAFRQVNGDVHLAQDVTQTVFADLARKAEILSDRASLSGWLYTSAHFAAAKIVRGERRRRQREEQFMREPANEGTPDADWGQIRPALDGAMHELAEADREAVLLRFFENQPYAEVGLKLALNENAARMRVDRALEKLRVSLSRRNIATAASLAAAISANAVQVAPAHLIAPLTAASLASAGTGSFTLLKIMASTSLKMGIGAVVLAGAVTALVMQHQAQMRLLAQNASLRQQIDQLRADNQNLARHSPAKSVAFLPPSAPFAFRTNLVAAETMPFTNLFSRYTNGEPKLTAAQVDAFLKAYRTNATCLLAAYRTSGDTNLLKSAMEKYPNDPQVAFEAALYTGLSPEEHDQWLAAFEKSAPKNALGNYLTAYNDFNSGQIEQGLQELQASTPKGLTDYSLERAQDDEEAYLSAGFAPPDAVTISDTALVLQQLSQIKKLGIDLVDLGKAYNQAGDPSSAQAAYQMAMNLGQRYQDPATDWTLISQLVGMAIQKAALISMDPNSVLGDSGQTVQEQLDQLARTKAAVNQLDKQVEPLFSMLSDQDMLTYQYRSRQFGEAAAMQWVLSKFGPN